MYRSRLTSALAMAALAAILLPSPLTAQITFQRTYGGTGWDEGYSVQQTTDGCYAIAGWTWSFGAGCTDVYLIKVNACGDTLWTRTYGGPDDDEGHSVDLTSDGGYVIAGVTASFGVGNYDVYLIKTNASGDTLWTRTYGGTGDDEAASVQETSDGGYIIAGSTYSFGAGDADVYLVKTKANGDTQWTRTFGGTEEERGYSVQQTTDGGYIVAGYTYPFGSSSRYVYLVKTNALGDTLWTKALGGHYGGSSVRQTADGGYVIAGYFFGAGDIDVLLVRTDADGDTVWTRTFGGTDQDWGYSVQQTSDGGYVIAGYTCSFGAGDYDAYLIKTDTDGDTLWTRTYGGTEGEMGGKSVQQVSDGGYVVAGVTGSYGAGSHDVYLIKTDSSGFVAVAEPKASPARAPAVSLVCEPNPTTGTTTIHLTPFASRLSPFALRIYDAQGCRVRTFTVNRTPCTVWDGEDDFGQPLPSGAYFVRLDATGEHATTRIVLQR